MRFQRVTLLALVFLMIISAHSLALSEASLQTPDIWIATFEEALRTLPDVELQISFTKKGPDSGGGTLEMYSIVYYGYDSYIFFICEPDGDTQTVGMLFPCDLDDKESYNQRAGYDMDLMICACAITSKWETRDEFSAFLDEIYQDIADAMNDKADYRGIQEHGYSFLGTYWPDSKAAVLTISVYE